MLCPHPRILLRILPLFLVSLAACLGGCGGAGSTGLQNKASANVSVSASSVSVTQGQAITLEAYVNPTLATGTVTFYDGTTAIGTAAISSTGFSTTGIALLTTTFSTIGPQSITAQYSGSSFYSASTSAAMTIGVYSDQLTPSSITLQASTTTPQYQTSVTLTAAVSPSSATGTVTFYNGGANIGTAAVNGGAASLITTFAAGGSATLKAVYSGDYNYASSTSNSLPINVSGPLVTSTNLVASTSATTIGSSVTLTAELTPTTATGTVTFYNGSTAIGTANVSAGVAKLNTTFASSGQMTLQASFAGNSSWEASASGKISLFVTGNTSDSVMLQVAPSSLVIGDFATLTVNVSPAAATGSVVFYNGTNGIGNCTIAGGTCTFLSYFMVTGSESLTAVYGGDTTYISSTSSPVVVSVGNPGPTPTITTLTLSEYSGNLGDSVTLTANVSPRAATGQVDFYDNGSFLAGVALSSGTAAWSQPFSLSDSNIITAVYDGDTTYSSSTSTTQDLELSDNSTQSPSCPTDPTLCQIECPADPTCPMAVNRTLPLEPKRPVFDFGASTPDSGGRRSQEH
jgi:hypothetical protein